jgi:CheY-like chemotaxis protein
MTAGNGVLIVDDDRLIAWHLSSMIERMGYRVCASVGTEEAAIAAAKENTPAVILMDVRLASGGDGVRAAEVIKAAAEVPIIFCTAHANDPAFRRRIGSFDSPVVLDKPIREDLLKKALLEVLRT